MASFTLDRQVTTDSVQWENMEYPYSSIPREEQPCLPPSRGAGRTGFPLSLVMPETHIEITKLSCLVCTPASPAEPGAQWVGAR